MCVSLKRIVQHSHLCNYCHRKILDALRTHNMGVTSSGAISNMLGFKYTLTAAEIAIPARANGTPLILVCHFSDFLSFLYSSKGIILPFEMAGPSDCAAILPSFE